MRKFLMLYVVFGLILVNYADAAEDNVHFSGALVSQPCTILDDDTDIKLDFGSIIEKSLYKYERTTGQPFSIHLVDCNPQIMKIVSITFDGVVDDELTSMLALDAVSSAKGVAIGLETENGTPLAINKESPYSPLTMGDNLLTYKAYVQAKPSAVQNNMIAAGEILSTATFTLNYQ
ncbi:fimbrial protein [Cronobacter turicensis]|nr:type 1 fimbrial protein [Cronobacter turicensis]